MNKKEFIYVCSPLLESSWEGIKKNMKKAEYYMALIKAQFGYRAIAPQSFLPEYLDNNIPKEREVAMEFVFSLIKIAKAVIVCGVYNSNSMKAEISKAKEWGIPIYRLLENEEGVMVIEYQEESVK